MFLPRKLPTRPLRLLILPHRRPLSTAAELAEYRALFQYKEPAKLHALFEAFEQNPRNMESARLYFRELNRHKQWNKVLQLAPRVHWRLVQWRTLPMWGATQEYYQLLKQVDYALAQQRALEGLEQETRARMKWRAHSRELEWGSRFADFLRFLPLVVLVGYLLFGTGEGKNQSLHQSYLQMRQEKAFQIAEPDEIKENLSDIRGIEEIREEVENLIHMLKEPELYQEKGAKQVKGVLLRGPPGTGKTMLARAIAKQSGVRFLWQSGSSFDEIFVGMGGLRVKQLFEEARKQKPCVIFIDEMDSLFAGHRRSMEQTSSRGTVNQFLSEMDGFQQGDRIMLIGATNEQEENLDAAALRPGRFDTKIVVPLPDVNGRQDIFSLYLSRICHSKDLDERILAVMTPGFSGAQIENLVNTAICEAVHTGKKQAEKREFEDARDRIMMGIERRSLTQTDRDRLKTAIHEAGHTLVCFFTPGARALYKATIVSRGPSLGATYFVPDEQDSTAEKKERVLASIDVCMGGHVAESLYIGKEGITSGCTGDFSMATQIAQQAVQQYGMFGSYASTPRSQQSEQTMASGDSKVREILEASHGRVKRLLEDKKQELRRVARALFEYDYLDAQEVAQVIRGETQLKKPKVRQEETEGEGKEGGDREAGI